MMHGFCIKCISGCIHIWEISKKAINIQKEKNLSTYIVFLIDQSFLMKQNHETMLLSSRPLSSIKFK